MSRIFPKLSKKITIAAKEGGPEPDLNPALRTAILNAKAQNMPKSNIDSAIKRASGKDAANFTETTYEGKGPHGVLVFVEAATDNTTRTVANVKSYFKIQQYRFNNRFELKIDINDEENTLSCRMPKLTLQPIIENAIYHGLETKLDKGLVNIKTQLTDKLLLIEIRDDGVGAGQKILDRVNSSFRNWKIIKTEKNEAEGMGIALTNVNSRIKMMYGEEYGLHMYSTENVGSMIEILLPRQDEVQ